MDYVKLKMHTVISRANSQKGTAKKSIEGINLSKKSYSIQPIGVIKEWTEKQRVDGTIRNK